MVTWYVIRRTQLCTGYTMIKQSRVEWYRRVNDPTSGGPTSAAVAQAGVTTGSYASTSTPAVRSRFCVERVVQGAITTTDEMLPACVPACRSACSSGVDAYDAEQRRAAGFGFTPKDESKVKGTCAARCAKECIKSGKAYDFIIPWRL